MRNRSSILALSAPPSKSALLSGAAVLAALLFAPTTSHALEMTIGTPCPPTGHCIGKILDMDFEIADNDWLVKTEEALAPDRLNYLEFTLTVYEGDVVLSVDDTRLMLEDAYSVDRNVYTFYVPVTVGRDVTVSVTNIAHDGSRFSLNMEGVSDLPKIER